MSRTVTVRSGGYVALCSGILTLLLLATVMAFLDPALKTSRDPDWMFWLGGSVLVALLGRSPFVGLVIGSDRVTRRSWVRSRSWPRSDVSRVATASYSGNLNRGSQSGRFLMIVLTVRGAVVEIPELTGGPRATDHRLRIVASELNLPEPSAPGRHRAWTPPT